MSIAKRTIEKALEENMTLELSADDWLTVSVSLQMSEEFFRHSSDEEDMLIHNQLVHVINEINKMMYPEITN